MLLEIVNENGIGFYDPKREVKPISDKKVSLNEAFKLVEQQLLNSVFNDSCILGESISSFQKIETSEANIERFKKEYPNLKHVRTGKDLKGIILLDKNNFVAVLQCDMNTKFIVALEVSSNYRNKGIASYLLKEAQRMGVNKLTVNKKNTNAIKLYKEERYKVYKQTDSMLFMSIGSSRFGFSESNSIDLQDDNEKIEEPLAKNNNFTVENPVINQYPELDKLLNDAKKIWISTDWHLWKEKDGEIVKNKNFDKILTNHNTFVAPKDIFIYLGDLVDDEMTDKDLLKATLKKFNGIKILVLGNNDLFNEEFYHECGFEFVLKAFKWNNLVFTHYPLKNFKDDGVNIHGHLHKNTYYNTTYGNHADVYTEGNNYKPILLSDILKKYEKGKYEPKERNHRPKKAESIGESIAMIDTYNPTESDKDIVERQRNSMNGSPNKVKKEDKEEIPKVIDIRDNPRKIIPILFE